MGGRPATTIVSGSDVVAGPGRSDFVKGGVSRQDRPGSIRITIQEAATLQSYPADFEFVGTKGKQFLQVGNACPPLLSQRVLEALLSLPASSPCNEPCALDELDAA